MSKEARKQNPEPMSFADLTAKVQAAQNEFDMAVQFHEVWKPTLYDEDLRRRMGVSYATNAFYVVRAALRREMLLALMRLWDRDARAIGMEAIAETLRKDSFIDSLAADRAARIGLPQSVDQMRIEVGKTADAATTLVDKYSKGGSHFGVRKKLQTLRNEHLAHRQTSLTAAAGADATDVEIEAFYIDNSKLIGLLLSLVTATCYDPQDTAGVYRYYATFFWAGARGEQTEGHPNYRAPHLAKPTT
jgi:hypothetical protein